MGDTDSGTLAAKDRPTTLANTNEYVLGPKLVTCSGWCQLASLAPSPNSSATLDITVSAACQLWWYVVGAEQANFHMDVVTGYEAFSFQIILPPYGETLALNLSLDHDVQITLKSKTAFSPS